MTVEVVPFTHIQEEIRDKCPEEYFTIIMRRFMMRIAEQIAVANGCKAIVTGENLWPGRQPDHGGYGRHGAVYLPTGYPACHMPG